MTVKADIGITGMGIVSCLGSDTEVFWSHLRSGAGGIGPISLFAPDGLRNDRAGEVTDFASDDNLGRGWDMALHACRQAILQADMPAHHVSGLVLATNFGSLDAWLPGEEPDGGNLFRPEGMLEAVREALGISGPILLLSDSCSSGAAAVAVACDLIRAGRAAVLACGFDALSLYALSGLSALRTLTAEEIRPFDRRRSGTIFGEGAGALLLEREAHAVQRKAPVAARIAGCAVNNNAHHLTAPDLGGMVGVIRACLRRAGMEAAAVDYINAHGTGTSYHDKAETQAVKEIFGARAASLPMSSIKAATGHTMGAAGIIEAIASIMAMRDGWLPPTLNYGEPDPECDLDCVPLAARQAACNCVLSLSAGIGGNNAALLLTRGGEA